MILPPGYIEADVDRLIGNLKDNLDVLLDFLYIGMLNVAHKTRSKTLLRLAAKVPDANRVIG